MSSIECRLMCHSLAEHVQPIYTGLNILHRRGLIKLSQTFVEDDSAALDEQHLKDASDAHAKVLLNGRIRLHYDAHDAHQIAIENVARCDFYFKRSFLRSYVDTLPGGREKIFPLGLNYNVFPDGTDGKGLRRAVVLGHGLKDKVQAAFDAVDAPLLPRHSARMRQLEALPDGGGMQRVLFLVNAYDPHDRPDRARHKVEEIITLNETRAQCIRLLRKALGKKFTGGFTHNDYTRRHYPELLVERHAITRRNNYLRTLRSFGICVATTGLHGSIGWKFGEYVAFSKAIVSQRLNYEVPGDLAEESHYLAFDTPEQCVEQCTRLIDEPDTCLRLMLNNARYYHSYVRPDALVMNTLLQALTTSLRPRAGAEASAPYDFRADVPQGAAVGLSRPRIASTIRHPGG